MSDVEPPPLTVVRPGEGRAAEPGSIGVVFKLWGEDTVLHTREDEYSIVTEGEIGFRSGDREVVLGAGRYICPSSRDRSRLMHARKLSADVTALQDYIPVPGFGALAVNAFVLHAAQPVLVDTGLPNSRAEFIETLGSVIDPADLRWIWVSHGDRDHIGSLYELLDVAPNARVVLTFECRGILNIERPLPVDRIYLLNPGQSLDLGDRRVTAFRPPLFDSPGVIGFTDSLTGTAFTSDCFGAPTSSVELSVAPDVAEVPVAELAYGQTVWATIDSAWVTFVPREVFARSLEPLRELDPPLLLSSHLPPALGRAGEFLDRLATVPDAAPFVGPDQAAFEDLLRKLAAPRAEAATSGPTAGGTAPTTA